MDSITTREADELHSELKAAEAEKRAILRQCLSAKRALIKALRSLKYTDYLKTDHWNAVRKTAIKRARNKCSLCNAETTTLHVHHRTYERIGRERRADVIALCPKCHEKHHDIRR